MSSSSALPTSVGEDLQRRRKKTKDPAAAAAAAAAHADRQPLDVNYDEVGMDMSDEDPSSEDICGRPATSGSDDDDGGRELFSSQQDFDAYSEQFNEPKSQRQSGRSSEYGRPHQDTGSAAARSVQKRRAEPSDDAQPTRGKVEHPGPQKKPGLDCVKKKPCVERRRASPEQSGSGKRASASDDKRSKAKEHRDHKPDKGVHSRTDQPRHRHHHQQQQQQQQQQRHHHHHHHHRHRSRRQKKSRSRSRSPSRSRSRERPHKDNHFPHCEAGRPRSERERQEARNRKLISMGLAPAVAALSHKDAAPTNNQCSTSALETATAVANSLANLTASGCQQDHLARVKAITGVELPKYYNPNAINALKYAEQIKKRQLLWGGKKPSEEAAVAAVATCSSKPKTTEATTSEAAGGGGSYNKWESTNFGDSQVNEKFRRLMGIKGDGSAGGPAAPDPTAGNSDSKKMFAEQEMEYERARAITHTQRGLGLGFSSSSSSATPVPPSSHLGINFVKK